MPSVPCSFNKKSHLPECSRSSAGLVPRFMPVSQEPAFESCVENSMRTRWRNLRWMGLAATVFAVGIIAASAFGDLMLWRFSAGCGRVTIDFMDRYWEPVRLGYYAYMYPIEDTVNGFTAQPIYLNEKVSCFPCHEYQMPGWIPIAATSIPTACMYFFAGRKPQAGHCDRCGYDLRGSVSDRCSECGTFAAVSQS